MLAYDFKEIEPHLADARVVAIDTETSSLNAWRDGKILAGMSIKALGQNTPSFYVPVRHANSENTHIGVVKDIVRLCRDKLIVMHNAPFDMAALYQDSINMLGYDIVDTMTTTRLTHEALQSYALKKLAAKFVDPNAGAQQSQLKSYMRRNKLTLYSDVPADVMEPYAVEDVVLTLGLYRKTMPLIEERGLTKLLDMEKALLQTLFKMQIHGMHIDEEYVLEQSATLTAMMSELEEKAFDIAGGQFNIMAAADIGKVFHAMGVRSPAKTEHGAESWAADVLNAIEHPLAKVIVQYRKAAKLNATYFSSFLELMDANKDIHPNINPAGARTGRLSCLTPNLMNLPRDTTVDVDVQKELAIAVAGKKSIVGLDAIDPDDSDISITEGLKVRDAFVPRDGYVFVFADYSQIEVRVYADYTKEYSLIRAMQLGADTHAYTYMITHNGELAHPDKEPKLFKLQRVDGKTQNFGILYGMGLRLLALKLNCTIQEAKAFDGAYKRNLPNARKFMEAIEGTIVRRGYVYNKFGRRRYLDPRLAYIGLNFLCQGTAADMMKRALVGLDARLQAELPDTRMLLTVHDEVIFEVRKSDVGKLLPLVQAEMIAESPLTVVPLQVGFAWSDDRWGRKVDLSCKNCDGNGFVTAYSKYDLLQLLYQRDRATLDAIVPAVCDDCEGRGWEWRP